LDELTAELQSALVFVSIAVIVVREVTESSPELELVPFREVELTRPTPSSGQVLVRVRPSCNRLAGWGIPSNLEVAGYQCLTTPRDSSIRSAATESPLALVIAFCSLRALAR